MDNKKIQFNAQRKMIINPFYTVNITKSRVEYLTELSKHQQHDVMIYQIHNKLYQNYTV